VQRFRSLVILRRGWFAAFLACALAVRLLVPTGFMPVMVDGAVTLQLCAGVMPAEPVHAMPGMVGAAHDAGHHPADHGSDEPRAEMPCSFAGVGAATLGSAPPLLLAASLAFVFLAVLRLTAPLLAPRPRLRPPLRAPPLSA